MAKLFGKTTRIIFVGLICLGVFFGQYFVLNFINSRIWQQSVQTIHISHSSFGITDVEFELDFNDNLFYAYSAFAIPRDENTENEGYQNIITLEPEKINRFFYKAAEAGFFDWESRYVNDVIDGHQWNITIHYINGHDKQIYGSNSYPPSWDLMIPVFEDLTGHDLLLIRSDWLDKKH